MARNDVYLNINSLSPADAVVTGQQDMTAATIPELVLGDTPTFNFYFTDNTNVWPSWAGNAAYTLTWALSDAVAGDFAPAATTGNATPITGGWSVVLPLNSYDLVGLLNTKRVGQPYPVQNLWQQLRVTDPSGNEITRAMVWTPVRYRAISDTQNTESASPTGGRFVTVNNVNTLTTPTAAQFYAANPVPTSALGTAANGELLIGNGTGFTKSTLTAGTGITVTNGSGSITIDATGAQETLTATVTNAEAVPITKGQVVYIFGATGNRPSVKLAYNTSDATSAKTFGVVSDSSISAGGTGTVTCVGVVDGLNLGAYQDGDTLYLGATPGSVTATKPYAPNHLVYVGIVERANAGNGELYVRVQNGYELDEIHDVQINSPRQSGQTLIYDNTTSLWKNARITAGSNIAVTNGDGSISIGFSGTLPVANGGTGVTTSTGSGSVVLSTSPTLTTPNIGAATGTSLNLTGSGTLGTTLTVNGTTDSSSKDTGAIVTEGGLGVEKSATFGGNLTVSGTGSFGGATGPHTFGNGAGAVEVRAVGDSSGYYGYSFYTGGSYESSLKHTAGSGILKLDVGRNSAWGGVFEIYADTTRAARFAKTSTTLDGNLTVSGSANLTNSSFNSYIYDGTGWVWTSTGTSGGTVKGGIYTAGGQLFITANSSLATNRFSLNSSGDATVAGNLTVSGTGTSSFAGAVTIANTASTSSYQTGLRLQSTAGSAPNTIQALEFYSSSLSTAVGAIDALREAGSFASSLRFYSTTSGGALTERGRFNSSGNLLLKSDGVDSANGRLQLATHTTSAGGIGFGTDTPLYRSSAGVLRIDGPVNGAIELNGTAAGIKAITMFESGTIAGQVAVISGSLLLRTGSSPTTALTLDSSQNATFAQGIVVQNSDCTLYRSTTATLTINNNFNISGLLRTGSSTPANASGAGVAGTITWDASYIYVCTAANTWKRVAIATW